MPSGSSYKPDDIIRAYNGKTIEIDNTDAEGRVTMADILSFASGFGARTILEWLSKLQGPYLSYPCHLKFKCFGLAILNSKRLTFKQQV